MSIRAVILDEMVRIARHHNRKLMPLTDNLPLVSSGFDSLCIAILVASLDDRLGVDPLDPMKGVAVPVTVGDLIELYKNAAL